MEQNKAEKTISMRSLVDVLRRCWAFVLAAVILSGAVIFVYRKLTYREKYAAESNFMMISENGSSGDYNTGNYSMDLKRVKDIENLLTETRAVMDETIGKLKATEGYTGPITRTAIKDSFRLETFEDSRFIKLHVTAGTQEDACALAKVLVEVAEDAVKENMDVDKFNVIDVGVPNGLANSVFSNIDFVLPFLFGVVVYAVFLMIYLLDDKIRAAEDVEKFLSLNLLGVVPNIWRVNKLKGRYYRYEYGDQTSKAKKQAEKKPEVKA